MADYILQSDHDRLKLEYQLLYHEAEKFRRHSVVLNSVAFRLGVALGYVDDEALEFEADIEEIVEQAVATIQQARTPPHPRFCEPGCSDGCEGA